MMDFYTNQVRTDGFGAQYLSIMFAILYVEQYLKKEYVFTPPNFRIVYGKDAKMMTDIMNLTSVFKQHQYQYQHVSTVFDSQTYPYCESHIDECVQSNTMDKIRKAYMDKNQALYTYTNIFTPIPIKHVAVHIRRPSMNVNVDIPEHMDGIPVKQLPIDDAISKSIRYTENKRFLQVMDKIRTQNDNRVMFHIVSEGPTEHFECFKSADVELHLNDPVEVSYCMLVTADILVTCWSSFSYSAGLLSKGQVWYQSDFVHRAPSHWHSY